MATSSQSTLMYVSLAFIFYEVAVTDNYLRITTRSCALSKIGRASPANILISSSLMILTDPLMSFYAGTSGRLP